MSYEMIVGLQIKDESSYAEYRKAMKPLLEKVKGGFRYDFKIGEVLKNEAKKPINRVFIIYFEDQQKKELFFSDPAYQSIKKQFFESAVSNTTIMAEYDREK